MTKEEVIKKLKKHSLSESEQIEIFNWFIKSDLCQERIAEFPHHQPGVAHKLSDQQIKTAVSPKAKGLLKYSISKIKEKLGL